MPRIQSRPTDHLNGTTDYFPYKSAGYEPRRPAYCKCGARLSVYRATGEVLCAPCQGIPKVDPLTLHPQPESAWSRQSRQKAVCPECGGPMHRQAKRCGTCFRQMWLDA